MFFELEIINTDLSNNHTNISPCHNYATVKFSYFKHIFYYFCLQTLDELYIIFITSIQTTNSICILENSDKVSQH
jgi:hypothetical protein